MTRTLLIAGLGYIGTELQRQASAAGWTVVGLNLSGHDGALACDLTSETSVADLAASLEPNTLPSAIVHCASSGRGGAAAYRAVFIDGCANLRRAFPEVPLVLVSSSSVYGQTDGSTVTEESPTEPDRETSRLLLDAERAALTTDACVTRLAGIYGPGRSVLLQRFLQGTAGIEDEGQRILNQIHRDDAASAILHLLNKPEFPLGEIFNVADSNPLTQLNCYEGLSELFSLPLPPRVPRDLNRKRAWTNKLVSNAKLLQSGWTPAFPNFLQAAQAVAESLNSSDNA